MADNNKPQLSVEEVLSRAFDPNINSIQFHAATTTSTTTTTTTSTSTTVT